MRRTGLALLAAVLTLTGCYHATIETGKTPSAMTVEKPFASSFIYGLVPPSTVDVAGECPNGVARVETKLSFVNQIVGMLTFGIYTPMSIKVTCAEAEMADAEHSIDLIVPEDSTPDDVRNALALAAEGSLREGRPMYVWLP